MGYFPCQWQKCTGCGPSHRAPKPRFSQPTRPNPNDSVAQISPIRRIYNAYRKVKARPNQRSHRVRAAAAARKISNPFFAAACTLQKTLCAERSVAGWPMARQGAERSEPPQSKEVDAYRRPPPLTDFNLRAGCRPASSRPCGRRRAPRGGRAAATSAYTHRAG